MRTTAPFVLVALLAAPALAQEQPVPDPDYSRETVARILSVDIGQPPKRESRIQYEFGAINFKALGMRWRIGFNPFLAALQGSQFNHQTMKQWPDPFILTGTEIATSPRSFRDRRFMSAELKRIDRITRKKAKVVVKP